MDLLQNCNTQTFNNPRASKRQKSSLYEIGFIQSSKFTFAAKSYGNHNVWNL